jgi:hypothetical protein
MELAANFSQAYRSKPISIDTYELFAIEKYAGRKRGKSQCGTPKPGNQIKLFRSDRVRRRRGYATRKLAHPWKAPVVVSGGSTCL